jgi:hypothetical protein
MLRCRYRTQYREDPPSDNAIRSWLNQFQETGSVVAAIENSYTANTGEHMEGN